MRKSCFTETPDRGVLKAHDAGVAAIGSRAEWLCGGHSMSYGYSEHSPRTPRAVSQRGKPVAIRCDQGTEFHFPTRDALIEGVYRRELEYLADPAKQLDDVLAPGEALHKWMRLFVGYIATKKVLASALCSTISGASELAASSRVQLLEAITHLLHRAAAAGDTRSDVDPGDLLRALAGFTYGDIGPGWEPSANRLIDLLMDGLRSRS